MEKIKLVIWDLDETFWKGTLSEEGIIIIEKNIEIVKTLLDRGIMNSIVSKNDYETTKAKLEELNIWEYFIFSKIEWLPKGELIKNTIIEAQLRAPNVLFLDDNHLNLEEAEFYNPGINVELPEFITNMLENPSLQGKNDINHSRLNQYKVLEAKSKKQKAFSNNKDFLIFSEIKIKFSNINNMDYLRIHELVERTNQLNFTKIRSSLKELKVLLTDSNYVKEKIEVWDKFGDYGVVGFYILDKRTNTLIHLVFSCRTMNIGIEQYVYARLGFPNLTIQGDVATQLNKNTFPDWIEEKSIKSSLHKTEGKTQVSMLLKGGCDLGQMIHYLQYKNINITTEFNTVNNKNIPLHMEHTIYAVDCLGNKNFYIDNKKSLDFIPFMDKIFYNTKLYDKNHDILVYSLLMDYTQEVYKHKTTGVKVTYGGYYNNLITQQSEAKKSYSYFNDLFYERFQEEYESIGQITPKDFQKNIQLIINNTTKPIIFINGAEINPSKSFEKDADKRHIIMNNVLDSIIESNNNVYLLDMRKIIVNEKDLEDNIRHYKRAMYSQIANQLMNLNDTILNTKSSINLSNYIFGITKHYLSKEIISRVKKLF